MYKVERKTTNDYWYEVMLSPFNSLSEVEQYLNKYVQYYPDPKDREYRITVNFKDL